MANYDDDFVEKFLAPWNWHDVDGALALMTDDSVWEVTRGSEPSGTLFEGTEEASGFFIPGLRDDALIGRICDGVALPVNVMVDLPPEKWTPGYADFASARSGVM